MSHGFPNSENNQIGFSNLFGPCKTVQTGFARIEYRRDVSH